MGLEQVMGLEQAFECPATLAKLRSGPLGTLLEGYCDWLLKQGFSRWSVRTHLSSLSHLNEHLGKRRRRRLQTVAEEDLEGFFRAYSSRCRHCGPREEPETQVVLDAVDGSARTGLRDQALLLLYNTGARASEIVNLKTTDLRLDDAPQVKLLGKGRKHRSCPLWPETAQALRAYLQQRASQEPSVEPLFLNAHGLALTRFGLRYIVRKYVAQGQTACPSLTGKRVSPHTIRHTTAMHLLRSGNEVNMVSYWLGHADINTTHVYVEIDMEMKRQMLQKAPAPAVHHARPWRKPGILEWLTNLTRAPQLCGVRHQSNERNLPGPAEEQAQLHIIPNFT